MRHLVKTLTAMAVDVVCVREACTKFPTGGMYATLAHVLLQSKINFLKKKSGHQVRTQTHQLREADRDVTARHEFRYLSAKLGLFASIYVLGYQMLFLIINHNTSMSSTLK